MILHRMVFLLLPTAVIVSLLVLQLHRPLFETPSLPQQPESTITHHKAPDVAAKYTTELKVGQADDAMIRFRQEVDRLKQERGLDEALHNIYMSYGEYELRALSRDNDVYATQALMEKASIMEPEFFEKLDSMAQEDAWAFQMAHEHRVLELANLAAAQGSLPALSSQLHSSNAVLQMMKDDRYNLNGYYRAAYGFTDLAVPIEWSLAVRSSAYAIVEGRRGSVGGPIGLVLTEGFIEGGLTLPLWQEAYDEAERLYANMARQRAALGLSPFNNLSGWNASQGDSPSWYETLSRDKLPDLEKYRFND